MASLSSPFLELFLNNRAVCRCIDDDDDDTCHRNDNQTISNARSSAFLFAVFFVIAGNLVDGWFGAAIE